MDPLTLFLLAGGAFAVYLATRGGSAAGNGTTPPRRGGLPDVGPPGSPPDRSIPPNMTAPDATTSETLARDLGELPEAIRNHVMAFVADPTAKAKDFDDGAAQLVGGCAGAATAGCGRNYYGASTAAFVQPGQEHHGYEYASGYWYGDRHVGVAGEPNYSLDPYREQTPGHGYDYASGYWYGSRLVGVEGDGAMVGAPVLQPIKDIQVPLPGSDREEFAGFDPKEIAKWCYPRAAARLRRIAIEKRTEETTTPPPPSGTGKGTPAVIKPGGVKLDVGILDPITMAVDDLPDVPLGDGLRTKIERVLRNAATSKDLSFFPFDPDYLIEQASFIESTYGATQAAKMLRRVAQAVQAAFKAKEEADIAFKNKSRAELEWPGIMAVDDPVLASVLHPIALGIHRQYIQKYSEDGKDILSVMTVYGLHGYQPPDPDQLDAEAARLQKLYPSPYPGRFIKAEQELRTIANAIRSGHYQF